MYLLNRLSLKHKVLVFILSKAYKTMADQNLLSGVNLLQLFSGSVITYAVVRLKLLPWNTPT